MRHYTNALYILILAAMPMAWPFETSANPDKVFLTFMCHPAVNQEVEYAVRVLCGNTATRVHCKLVSLIPVSGDTNIGMKRLKNWAYGSGKIKFAKAGKTRIKANVYVTNEWGSLVLQDEIELFVKP